MSELMCVTSQLDSDVLPRTPALSRKGRGRRIHFAFDALFVFSPFFSPRLCDKNHSYNFGLL